jgi:hypothetical protein
MPELSTAPATEIPEPLKAEALEMARTILTRLADEEAATAAASAAEETTGYPVWRPTASLYSGAAGTVLALAYAARALPAEADHWLAQTHRWLRTAAQETHNAPISSASLAVGTAGLALAVAEAATIDPRFSRTLPRLHRKLAEQVEGFATDTTGGLSFGDYDVIAGPAGILGHLTALPAGAADAYAQKATVSLVDWIVQLTSGGWRSWRIPPRNYPPPRPIEHKLWPYGYADIGLAHGVPGPLAALSRARLNGDRREDVHQAIKRLCAQLASAARPGRYGPVWPRVMPFDANGEIAPEMADESGPAYCYGPPGICSALLDAADALEDGSVRALAVEGFEATVRLLADAQRPETPGLCHGVAGLMLISRKFQNHTAGATPLTAALTEDLLSRCDAALPLGVQDFKPTEVGQPGSPLEASPEGRWIDDPGLLEGAAGVALALLSVATAAPIGWARALLVG